MINNKTKLDNGLNKFITNMKKSHGNDMINCHNIYQIYTEDMDGNITSEAYAINVLTTNGFTSVCYNNGAWGAVVGGHIYLGTGTTKPTVSDTTLESPITTVGSTVVSDSKNNIYAKNMIYDSDKNLIIGRAQVYKGYFDYNMTNITSTITATEIGFGETITNLYTHALIYNENGELSSISKNINERLIITMFWSISCSPDIINNAYDKGVLLLMSPLSFIGRFKGTSCVSLYGNSNTLYDTNGKSMNYNFCGDNRIFDNSYSDITFSDNIYYQPLHRADITLQTSQYSYVTYSAMVSDRKPSIGTSQSLLIYQHIKMNEPEELVSTSVFTDYVNSNEFTFAFTKSYDANYAYGVLPASDFVTTSVSMYNHLTKDWDISEEFIDTANTDYSNSMIFALKLQMTYNNADHDVYVFGNDNTSLPIKKFDNPGLIIYATDSYWDTTTWVKIDTISNIEEPLRTKRYYIVLDFSTFAILSPVRDMNIHGITGLHENYKLPDHPGAGNKRASCRTLVSNNYGWVFLSKYLIYPNSENKNVYALDEGLDISYLESKYDKGRWATDDTIIVYTTPTQMIVHTISDDPTVAPTRQVITLNFTTPPTNRYGNDLQFSFTNVNGDGYLIIQNKTSKECIILQTHGDTSSDNQITQINMLDTLFANMIYMTTKMVYMTTDETNTFIIHDVLDASEDISFSISTEYTVEGIIGWKNYIYIRVLRESVYSTFFYNIQSSVLMNLPEMNIESMTLEDYSSNETNQHSNVYNDECLVMNARGPSSKVTLPSYIISADNPTVAINIKLYNIANASLQYVNNGKQLLMSGCADIYSNDCRCRYILIDIGAILDGNAMTIPCDKNWYNTYASYWGGADYYNGSHFGIFNEDVIYESYDQQVAECVPYQYYMPHKVVGTTKTIQSYNNPKKIIGGTIDITLTNLPADATTETSTDDTTTE